MMQFIRIFLLMVLLAPVCVWADAVAPAPVSEPSRKKPSVYAVYGRYEAAEYMPEPADSRRAQRSRKASQDQFARPSLSLPRSFYVICAPIILVLYISEIVKIANDMSNEDKESTRDVIGSLGH